MAICLRYFLIVVVTLMCLGCTGKSVEPNTDDRGTYTLQATPTSVQSYRGGEEIFTLCMTPGEDFAGAVQVSVVADPALSAQLLNQFLTSESRIAEVTIRPKTTAALRTYPIEVIHTHASVSDTLICNVEMVDSIPQKEFLDTLWQLESFEATEGEIIKPANDQIYSIQFEEDNSFVSISHCNEIVGDYERQASGSLVIDIFARTKIYCGEESLGEEYYEALGATRSYEIDENRLYIYYGNNSNSRLNFIDE